MKVKIRSADGNQSVGDVNSQSMTLESGALLNVLASPTSMVNRAYVDAIATTAGFSPGDIKFSSSSANIPGFLRCNGSSLLINSFLPLFNVIGQSFNQRLLQGSGNPHQFQHDINNSLTGNIRQWNVNGTNLPLSLSKTCLLATISRIYLIGNRTATAPENSVRTTTFNAGGVFGAWSTHNNLPAQITFCQSVVTNNRFYLLGGENSSAVTQNTVFFTDINTSGIIGSWGSLANLPFSIARGQAIVTSDLLYIIGGTFGSAISHRVIFSQIQANRTLGAWLDGPSLPIPLNTHSVAVVGNRVYVIGGQTTGNIYSNRVFMSIIDGTGRLGNWVDIHRFPLALIDNSVFVTRTNVYSIGGQTTVGGARVSDIYTAKIHPDNSLGSWEFAGPYGAAISGAGIIGTDVGLTVLGGATSNTAATNVIRTFPTTGGVADYSALNEGLYNIGSHATHFRIPDYSHLERNNLFAFIKT